MPSVHGSAEENGMTIQESKMILLELQRLGKNKDIEVQKMGVEDSRGDGRLIW